MFVFLAIFIVFLLYINFLMHKNKRAQENLEKQFWNRERSANFTRKKDISNLNYLIITEDKIPQNLTTDAKKSLETLCGQKMLNLSSMSNTDLKLEYGVANLDELSACDDRFSTFERNAAIYAQELSDAGYTDQARQLLEFAVSCHVDNSSIYTRSLRRFRKKSFWKNLKVSSPDLILQPGGFTACKSLPADTVFPSILFHQFPEPFFLMLRCRRLSLCLIHQRFRDKQFRGSTFYGF